MSMFDAMKGAFLPVVAGLGLLAACMPAKAAVITASGVTSVAGNSSAAGTAAPAPGSSTDFDFFGNSGSQPSILTNFTQTTTPPSSYPGNGAYTFLQPPGGGTAFRTGIGYRSSAGTATIATFQSNAGSGTNRSFTEYVLFGNTDGIGVMDSSIGLSVNGGTPITQAVTDTTNTNDFAVFTVAGANPGDTFAVSASASNQPYIGGVTFSALTPEPASLSLLGMGSVVLLVRRRRI
jgi:hypothetical protein